MPAKPATIRAALYLRVSTGEQTTDNQRRELEEAAARHGWEVVAVYEDAGVSGAKGRDARPQFDRMLKDATRRKFDVLGAWSVDRLGRSLQHLVECLSGLHASGVDLYLHQQAVDTRTPSGRAMFGMLGVFAEFERAMIQERVKAGMARARAAGKTLGRPKADEAVEQRIRDLRAQGVGLVRIARELGVGVSLVQRVTKADAPMPA